MIKNKRGDEGSRSSLKSKDQIVYEILDDKTVVVRKASSLDKAYLQGVDHTLGEWNSEDDEKAYKD